MSTTVFHWKSGQSNFKEDVWNKERALHDLLLFPHFQNAYAVLILGGERTLKFKITLSYDWFPRRDLFFEKSFPHLTGGGWGYYLFFTCSFQYNLKCLNNFGHWSPCLRWITFIFPSGFCHHLFWLYRCYYLIYGFSHYKNTSIRRLY